MIRGFGIPFRNRTESWLICLHNSICITPDLTLHFHSYIRYLYFKSRDPDFLLHDFSAPGLHGDCLDKNLAILFKNWQETYRFQHYKNIFVCSAFINTYTALFKRLKTACRFPDEPDKSRRHFASFNERGKLRPHFDHNGI